MQSNRFPRITRRRALLGAAACFVSGSAPARAQGGGQPIRFLVGAAAGGAIDAYARVVAEPMSRTLGRSIIVEARPGAAGNLSAQAIMDAPPDGDMVWVGTMAMTEINPSVFSNLKWSRHDFAPIIKGVDAPLVFVVHNSVPARTLDEFVAWAKKNPGKLSYSSYSPGTPSHFLGALMNDKFGLDMGHLPYRGSGPQMIDMIAGHTILGFTQTQSAEQHVKSGVVRAIATTGDKRFYMFPDTPTFAELGHPEFNCSIWFGLLVNKATPPAIVQKLTDAAVRAHQEPAIREALRNQGLEVSGLTGEPFRREIDEGAERWAKLVKASGFKAN